MSTNAKAWDLKASRKAGQTTQQHDPQQQNTGKCDNCRYRVSKQERIHYDCPECGTYIVSTPAQTWPDESILHLNFVKIRGESCMSKTQES
jgi:predicted RNA-binding Zn-ribbon protein involved in translation (DUF1610 family)